MNKLMEERERERERVCVCVCMYVCVCERETGNKTETAKCQQSDQGKMKTYGTQVQFPFIIIIILVAQAAKEAKCSPKMLRPTAHPDQLQVTTANKFTKQTDLHYNVTHWGPLTTENCTLLSARRPAQPQAWRCPNSHHKFLKMITPFTFLLYFLPRLFTTTIYNIICSRQH